MHEMQQLAVVKADEMARVESLAYDHDFSEDTFMQAAGKEVARVVLRYLQKKKKKSRVLLLAGKGNNGGDGYVAALELIKKGYEVIALQPFDKSSLSPLCKKYHELFKEKGKFIEQLEFSEGCVIIDALLGTGFKGELKSPLAEITKRVNESDLPIFSIDIPSGVDGSTGKAAKEAIKAYETIFLGLAKVGFFIREGYEHIGKLTFGDFGLTEEFTEKAKAYGYLVDEDKLQKSMPIIKRKRHKYEAGYLIGVGGSKGMGGALKLSGLASLRVGAGIVRLFYPKEAEDEMENAPLELIREAWSVDGVTKALQKAKALFIGPGCGRKKESFSLLQDLLSLKLPPLVIDADALFFLSENPNIELPVNTILTPHEGEMLRLIKKSSISDPETLHQEVAAYASKKNVIIVLKGAPTFIFYPEEKPLIIPRGDPGMATAGTGDVLTGMIAAFLAEGVQPDYAALLGVYTHGIAGEIAAKKKTSYGVIASDLIEYAPQALKKILQGINSYE